MCALTECTMFVY